MGLTMKTDVLSAVKGDYITCDYGGRANEPGAFSNLGTATKPLLIDPTALSAPNGSFNFIMVGTDVVGRKIFIADRNIHYMTFDYLNTAGYCNKEGLKIGLISWNPSDKNTSIVLDQACMRAKCGDTQAVRATVAKTSGKWYWEIYMESVTSCMVGIANSTVALPSSYSSSYIRAYGVTSGYKHPENQLAGPTLKNGDVLGLALDMDLGTLKYYKNGVYTGVQHTAFASSIPYLLGNGANQTMTANFGKDEFAFVPPEGYAAYDDSTKNMNCYIRIPTGGVSLYDKDNEWYNYIVNNDLDGNVTKNDPAIWNTNHPGRTLWSATLTHGSDSYYVGRGKDTPETWINTSNDPYFRPMLIVEPLFFDKYLIQDGNDIKTYTNNAWVTLGQAPATEEMFLSGGMSSLKDVNKTTVNELTSNNIGVLIYEYNQNNESKDIVIERIPQPQLILANGDIKLTQIEELHSISLAAAASGGGVVRAIMSVDKGVTWKSYYNSEWTSINVEDLNDVKVKGMSPAAVSGLTGEQLLELTESAETLRFGYYLEIDAITDNVYTDQVSLNLDMKGEWEVALNNTDYTYDYPSNKSLKVSLLVSGSYKVNY